MREQNLPLICCQLLEMLIYFEKVFKYLHTLNIGSIGQRAAKLLAVNVGDLKKKVYHPAPAQVGQSARVRFRAKSNHSQSLMAGNFAAL